METLVTRRAVIIGSALAATAATSKQLASGMPRPKVNEDVLQRGAVGLLGLRVHEAEPAGTVQRTAFRGRDHHLVCSLVSPVRAQLSQLGRAHSGAQCQRRPRHDLEAVKKSALRFTGKRCS
ncbi:MAG: hypothetical protein JWP08_996 [Bryobacterales bacterium]|nr:hypothetical protein [Bryobacterales bacterium]